MSKLKSKILLPVLLLLSVVVYRVWFFQNSILVHGDWNYYTHQTQLSLLRWLPGWSSNGLGGVNQSASFYPLDVMWGLFARITSFSVAERLIFMVPSVVIAVIGCYLLIQKLFENKTASFMATLFFMFNSYFMIVRTGDLTIAAAGAFIPFILWLVLKVIERKSLATILITAIVCSIQSFYDFRIFYITLFIMSGLVLVELFGKSRRQKLRIVLSFTLVIVAYVLLNLYWLLGFLKLGQITSNVSFATTLFGSEYYDLNHSLALSHPFWTLKGPTIFDKQAVPFYDWLIPIFSVIGLYVGRKNKKVIYFGIVSLIGILLTKQIAEPLPHLYLWLFNHFPGFNAFREASKFYLITAVAYSVLIARFTIYLVSLAKRNNRPHIITLKWAGLGVMAVVFGLSALPIVLGKGDSLFVARKSPGDYAITNSFFTSQKGFYRTAWLPSTTWWNTYTKDNPMVGVSNALSDEWKATLDSPAPDLSLTSYNRTILDLQKPNAQQTFVLSGIRYLVIPTRDSQNSNDGFNEADRDYYVSSVDNIPWLKKVALPTKELAVYEIQKPKDYFSASTVLFGLDPNQDVSATSSFITQNLHKDFAYTSSQNKDAQQIKVPFDSISKDQISRGVLNSSNIDMPQGGSIFTNQNAAVYNYSVSQNNITFSQAASSSFSIDTNKINAPALNDLISYPLNTTSQNYIQYGTEVFPVDTSNGSQIEIGSNRQALNLVTPIGPNLITNPNLNDGLWQNQVTDCNNYDSKPVIGLSRAFDSKLGENTVDLSALRHSACTGPDQITVTPGDTLLLQFRYSVVQGKETSYRLTFNGGNETVIKYISVADSNWRTYRTVVAVPNNATSMNLQVVSTPNEDTPNLNKVSFTDFTLQKVNITNVFKAQPFKSLETRVGPGNHQLSISDNKVTNKNEISNPSLERGLWKKNVGDCNNHDSNGRVGMALSDIHSGGSEKSLELYAYNHIACTGPNDVSVEAGGLYLFSFDHLSTTNSNAGYTISFNDDNRTVIKQDSIVDTTKSWSTFKRYVSVPQGATKASITFYSTPDETANKKSVNYYDNPALIKTSEAVNEAFALNDSLGVMSAPSKIESHIVSSTFKYANITSASKSFYLSMSEAYHPGWQLYVVGANGTEQLVTDHIELNQFSNGWFIDLNKICGTEGICKVNKDSSFDFKLIARFTPQSYFTRGLIISISSFVIILLVAPTAALVNKKRHRKTLR